MKLFSLQISLRELLLVFLVVGVILGWRADRYRQAAREKQLLEVLEFVDRSANSKTFQIEWHYDRVLIHGPKGTRTIRGEIVGEIIRFLERRTDW